MENVQEINFYGSIYREIIRQSIRNFEAIFDEFQTEPDLGYESGNEFDTDETNINSEIIEADEGIESD